MQIVDLNSLMRVSSMPPKRVPETVFHLRERDETEGNFVWKALTSAEIFRGRKVVLFALPGAFTPACSETHVPGFEAAHDALKALGIDDVYCLSVNDAFVMNQWAKQLGISKVRMLPDGNGDFSGEMGMLVARTTQGLGARSWRYSMVVEDCEIIKMFAEANLKDNPPGVPVEVSDAETLLKYLSDR